MVRLFGAATLLATTMALAPSGWAQTNPSADQLIQQLAPTSKSLSGTTRGLRPVEPGSPVAATGAPSTPRTQSHGMAARVPAPAAEEAPSANLYVQFATGSAELTPQAMATLDELGKALSSSQLSAYRFRIEGHTDTVGARDYNLSLSERRATAVAAYIEHKFGISDARLNSIGLGPDHLLVPTPPQTPEARNRRVEVINLGA